MKGLQLVFGVIVLLLLFQSCSNQPGKATDAEEETTTDTTAPFPIHDSFADIADIFTQQSDTTYVINFWATWCKPCVKELPYFEALHDRFTDTKLKVILVSLDFKKDIEPKLIPFVKEHALQSDVIALTDHKYNEWIDKVDPEWGGAIPVTIVYNKAKRQFIGESFANEEELTTLVQEMLEASIW